MADVVQHGRDAGEVGSIANGVLNLVAEHADLFKTEAQMGKVADHLLANPLALLSAGSLLGLSRDLGVKRHKVKVTAAPQRPDHRRHRAKRLPPQPRCRHRWL